MLFSEMSLLVKKQFHSCQFAFSFLLGTAMGCMFAAYSRLLSPTPLVEIFEVLPIHGSLSMLVAGAVVFLSISLAGTSFFLYPFFFFRGFVCSYCLTLLLLVPSHLLFAWIHFFFEVAVGLPFWLLFRELFVDAVGKWRMSPHRLFFLCFALFLFRFAMYSVENFCVRALYN